MEEQNKSTQETAEQAEEREDRFVFIDLGSAELKAHLRKMADRKYTTITGVIKEWVRIDMEVSRSVENGKDVAEAAFFSMCNKE